MRGNLVDLVCYRSHWRHICNPVPPLYHTLSHAQSHLQGPDKDLAILSSWLHSFSIIIWIWIKRLPVAYFWPCHQFAEHIESSFQGARAIHFKRTTPPRTCWLYLPSLLVSLLTRAWWVASACFPHRRPFMLSLSLFLMTPSSLSTELVAHQTFLSRSCHNKELCVGHRVTSAGKNAIQRVKPSFGPEVVS